MALKNREGWIFDLDGTLTVAAHDFDAIRRELGLEPAEPILEQLARLPRDEASARHAQLDEIEWRIAGAARPAPGALALLQVLSSGGMRLGIVTRNSHRNALRTLQSCGLEAFFKPCCIIGREAATPKPDPDGVQRIGCGAGPACHGQIVVLQDLLGLTDWQPAFAKPIVQLGDQVAAAAGRWIAMVATSQLGEHPYRMPPAEAGKF